MEMLQQMIVAIRGLRKEMGVPEKEAAPVRVFASEKGAALAGANVDLLRRLAKVSDVQFAATLR